MYSDTAPKPGDSDNVLLGKICEVFNTAGSGNFPPMPGDSDNDLLSKIARLLAGE
jgi:hypothetical protein